MHSTSSFALRSIGIDVTSAIAAETKRDGTGSSLAVLGSKGSRDRLSSDAGTGGLGGSSRPCLPRPPARAISRAVRGVDGAEPPGAALASDE